MHGEHNVKKMDCMLGMVKQAEDGTSYGIQFRRLPYMDLMLHSSALLSRETLFRRILSLQHALLH
jgi:hypothetical protein